MSALEDARKRWVRERPEFGAFGKEIEVRLAKALRQKGFWSQVSSRAKEVDSLIRKLIIKPHHTYDSLGDKCGVRVIVRYKDEIAPVLKAAQELFACGIPEHTGDRLSPQQMGYLSTHVGVTLYETDQLVDRFAPAKFRAELQIRTSAQHLWSEMSHDSLYKNDETISPLSNELKRRVYILAAAVELADNEFTRLNHDMPHTPEYDLLKSLERHYFAYTTRRGDQELSRRVIGLLLPLYGKDAREVSAHLDEFCAQHAPTLERVYEDAGEDPERSAFIYQPEALLIFDLLQADQVAVRQVWNTELPEEELERVANAFGISFD